MDGQDCIQSVPLLLHMYVAFSVPHTGQRTFRLRAQACLLTHNSLPIQESDFPRVCVVVGNFRMGEVVDGHHRTSLHAADQAMRLHLHAFVEFTQTVDWATTAPVAWRGLRPNVQAFQLMEVIRTYPLVNGCRTMERSTIFHGKINFFEMAMFKFANCKRQITRGGSPCILNQFWGIPPAIQNRQKPASPVSDVQAQLESLRDTVTAVRFGSRMVRRGPKRWKVGLTR